jgi:membrane protein implicated in regulation of membrane protease activity
MLVMISQMLLIALAIAWVVHMVIIAANGAIYFVEAKPVILWAEISATALITLFATAVFALQLYRLGERRKGDRRQDRTSGLRNADSVPRQKKVEKYVWTRN